MRPNVRSAPDVLVIPVPHGGWRVSNRAVREADAVGVLGFVESVDGGFETLALSHPEDHTVFATFDEALQYLIESHVDHVQDEKGQRAAGEQRRTSHEAMTNNVMVTAETGERIALVFDEPRGRGPSIFFRGLTRRLPRVSGPYDSVDDAIGACRHWYEASGFESRNR